VFEVKLYQVLAVEDYLNSCSGCVSQIGYQKYDNLLLRKCEFIIRLFLSIRYRTVGSGGQELRTKSQEPGAKNQEPRIKSQETGAKNETKDERRKCAMNLSAFFVLEIEVSPLWIVL
jgi:hypothetical protein